MYFWIGVIMEDGKNTKEQVFLMDKTNTKPTASLSVHGMTNFEVTYHQKCADSKLLMPY